MNVSSASIRDKMIHEIAMLVGPIMETEVCNFYPNKTPEQRGQLLLTDKSCQRLYQIYCAKHGYEKLVDKLKK